MSQLQSRSILRDCDVQAAELRGAHPGWWIWFVPHGSGGGVSHVVWCAQPEPLLNCHSLEELAEQMDAADGWRTDADSGPSS